MQQPAYTPFRISESMTPAEIGPYFAELRVKFNLTLQDIADRLHIRTRYLASIEAGRFDELPGMAYARGYVHSYATFLGLDADQVANLCFPPKPAQATTHAAVKPAPAKPTLAPVSRPNMPSIPSARGNLALWRGVAIAAVVAILAVLIIGQVMNHKTEEAPQEPIVASVPEDMLASVRTGLMPNAQNFECFMGEALLGCMNASQAMRAIFAPDLFALRELGEDDMAELESLGGSAASTEENDE
jgi:hypothetical protein